MEGGELEGRIKSIERHGSTLPGKSDNTTSKDKARNTTACSIDKRNERSMRTYAEKGPVARDGEPRTANVNTVVECSK